MRARGPWGVPQERGKFWGRSSEVRPQRGGVPQRYAKAAEIEQLKQGLHDPSSGLLERPGLNSGLDLQAPRMLLKAAEIEQLN